MHYHCTCGVRCRAASALADERTRENPQEPPLLVTLNTRGGSRRLSLQAAHHLIP